MISDDVMGSLRLPPGSTIMVLGSGPIVIGQACEFDYSGTQACKALKELGYRVVLVNSNPATIMTDESVADATYLEPLTVDYAKQVVAREKPDALLPTVGGQVGLNLALDLWRAGVLDEHNVELIGAKPDAIDLAEGPAALQGSDDRAGHRRGQERHRPLHGRGRGGARDGGPARHHPPELHPGRRRWRRGLEQGGVQAHRGRGPRPVAHHPDPGRAERARVEGIRDGGHA